MDPFSHLGEEHKHLESMLDVLESLADTVQSGAEAERADLDAVIDYLREFGDLSHHDKEETILVPALVEAELAWYDGPLADLRREHRQERYLLRSLRHLARRGTWSRDDCARFVGLARELVTFLRGHIEKENTVLFPLARQKLSSEKQAAVLEEFRKLDADLDAPDHAAIAERARSVALKHRKS